MFFDFYRKASLVDITYKKMDVAEDNENQPEESIFIAKIEQNYYLKILYVTGLVLLHLFLLIGAFDIILDPAWTKFPEKCTQPIGCTRVYYDNTSNRYGTQVENITFNNSNLNQIIEDWQKTNLQTNVKLKSDNFYHFTFTTLVLGFVDDMEVKIIKCKDNPNMSSVYSQSELRIGKYDIEVNNNRIKDFYDYLSKNIENKSKDRCK